jgi:hypothetical protein
MKLGCYRPIAGGDDWQKSANSCQFGPAEIDPKRSFRQLANAPKEP